MRLLPKDRDLSLPLDRIELRVRACDFQKPVEGFALRLDRFLAEHLTWRSRASIQGLVREQRVLLDVATPEAPEGSGTWIAETRPGRKLRHGSRVLILIPEESRVAVKASELALLGGELTLLFEDESALAVDKPPMLAVHPGGRHLTDTLIQRVHALLGVADSPRSARPRLCHRLDRETSGVVLIGKDPRAHAEMMRQFEEREVEKEYLAIVRGAPQKESGTIDLPLAPARASRVGLKMAVAMDGMESRTDWRVVERFSDCALIAARPFTGRQHQIRVHLAAIGLPLVGDKLYGASDHYFDKGMDGTLDARDLAELGLERHALHNHRLRFTSPASGQVVEVQSALARDMAEFLARRRKAGSS